jgi:hypothetical protein
VGGKEDGGSARGGGGAHRHVPAAAAVATAAAGKYCSKNPNFGLDVGDFRGESKSKNGRGVACGKGPGDPQ